MFKLLCHPWQAKVYTEQWGLNPAFIEISPPIPRDLRDPADIPHRIPNRTMRRHPGA